MKKVIVLGNPLMGMEIAKKLHKEEIEVVNETTAIDEPEPMTLTFTKIADKMPLHNFVHKSKYHK